MTNPVKLAFLLRSMGQGGAERQLLTLLNNLNSSRYRVGVFLFYEEGALLNELTKIESITVVTLHKKSRWDLFGFYISFVQGLRNFDADILYSYLDIPNIFAALAGKQTDTKTILGVRSSDMQFSRYGVILAIAYWVEIVLSHLADRIVSNSFGGHEYHIKRGFPRNKTIVIPNGIDIKRYQKHTQSPPDLRSAWGIADENCLIGLVARLDPMKGHSSFLKMASLLLAQFPQARFVCVGDGEADYVEKLRSLADELALTDSLVWAGSTAEMPPVYNSLDILVSSSIYGEGFSNVIGEAMACEIPCVVTNVGDSAYIVGETGRVVTPNDPEALAVTVSELIQMPAEARAELGRRARQRIQENFSVAKMVASTEKLFDELMSEPS